MRIFRDHTSLLINVHHLCVSGYPVFLVRCNVLTKVLTNSIYFKSELGHPSAGTCVYYKPRNSQAITN